MRFVSRAALGAAAIAGVLCYGTTAHAYRNSFTVSKCLSAKVKTEAKGVSAYAGCYAKGASKGLPTDPACLSKTSGKNTSAFGKLDIKNAACQTLGDGGACDSDAASYASSLDAAVGHAAGKCDTAKTKNVGKYIAAIGGCYAKAAGKAPGLVDNAIGGCTDKSKTKLIAAITKAEDNPDCSNAGNGLALLAAADNFLTAQSCLLDPSSPDCAPVEPNNCLGGAPNGVLNAGEDCDPTGGPATSCATAANAGGTCTSKCNCLCPTTVTFSGNAADAASVLDTGWTGLGHRAPIIANGDVTVGVSCPAGGFSRPCGTCTISGPVENPNAGAGQLRTRRCSNETWKTCTSNANCSGGGTCEYFFGSNLPLVAGGVGTCVVNQFKGAVSGTANIESGEAKTVANLISKVYTGGVDNPCPICSDAGGINDGSQAGTCDSGPRAGQACDANGFVPGRPDFGRTSLDCPPAAGNLAATLPIDLSNATDPVTKTLSTSSPNCSDGSGQKCLCETCNNAEATPCSSNADGTAVGATVCGGKRCVGGTNEGTVCTNNANCTGGGLCGTAGEPSKPSACLDDTNTAGFDCSDTVPVDGEGSCLAGPVTKTCSVASGHGQRSCANDADCGGGGGTCVASNRPCFLTGGLTGPVGTNTLTAIGMEDAPMTDTSNPTLAAVFCVGPTTASAVNTAAGLPGPGRVTIRGTAVGTP
jgi:hypothetical protein